MSDQLRDQFEAFRAASTAQTTPPGVPAIRKTVARRHVRRAAVLAAAAITVAVVALVPGHHNRNVGPVRPPLPSSSPSLSPAPSAGPTPSSVPPPTPGATTHPASPKGGSTACGPFRSFPESSLLTSDGPDSFALTDTLLHACPNAVLHITRAAYIGTGASSSNLTLYDSSTHTLTPSARSTTMPAMRMPAGSCYTALVVTVVGSGLPHTITNIVPKLVSSGSNDEANLYFGNRGFQIIEADPTEPSC